MHSKSFLGKRFEFKYLLNAKTAKQVEKYLLERTRMTPDSYSKHGAYFVNSLYFDTPLMNDYRDKDGSFLVRKKLRARMYEAAWHPELDRVWLEVKHKHNMNVKKTRTTIAKEVWDDFIKNNDPLILLANLNHQGTSHPQDLRTFAEYYLHQHYRPLAVVRYRRRAYLADFISPVRITFDYDIQTCRYENSHQKHNLIPVSHQNVVMEIKFNNKLPWWFKELLTHFDLQRTDFSKYRNSVAVMRGIERIPVNK